MRTLAMLLAAAALSWAHVAWAEEPQQQRDEKKAQQTMEQAGEEMQQQGARVEEKGREMMHEAQAETHSRWEGKSNFDLQGKISKVGRNSITLTREDLPAATLKVSKETRIELDGTAASIKELKQGQEVKASFNLEGDKPLAVEIKAEKAK